MKSTTHYGSFNARWLDPERVAKSFVPVPQFRQLVGSTHSILMGPRGCGKTTLLKMLTHRALSAWRKEPRSERFKDLFDFPGYRAVYIPADTRWSYELESMADETFMEHKLTEQAQRVMVTCNGLIQLLSELESLVYSDALLQVDICRAAIKLLHLQDTIPVFHDVKAGLESIVTELRGLINSTEQRRVVEFLGNCAPSLYAHILDAPIALCNRACEILPRTRRPSHWALCYDELEISPQWLQTELLTSLRSVQQNFLLKLTWSPVLPSGVSSAPESQADFRPIRLWSSHIQDPRIFCENLTQDFLNERFPDSHITPHEFLGPSVFAAEGEEENADIYEEGAPVYKVMKDLARLDRSFAQFLTEHNIDTSRPVPITIEDRDAIFRKMKPIALLRREFWRGTKGRSRKLVRLYAGKEAVYAVSEGNPRWLLGLLTDLADLGTVSAECGAKRKVPEPQQARILNAASRRFQALLKAFPTRDRLCTKPTEISLFDFLDRIATFFYTELHEKPFSIDPAGSIVVLKEPSPAIAHLITRALEVGAFIAVGSSPQDVPYQIAGSRFRLSFMLAPAYRLALRNYRPVAMNEGWWVKDPPSQLVLKI